MSNKLRTVLTAMNMRMVAESAGISYDVLRNFKKGQKEHLTNEEFNAVVEAIKNLTNMKGDR